MFHVLSKRKVPGSSPCISGHMRSKPRGKEESVTMPGSRVPSKYSCMDRLNGSSLKSPITRVGKLELLASSPDSTKERVSPVSIRNGSDSYWPADLEGQWLAIAAN